MNKEQNTYVEFYHSLILSGMQNNLSNRESRLPIELLLVAETNEDSVIVVTSNILSTCRNLDWGLQEYAKIYNHYSYERKSISEFVITIEEKMYGVTVIDKNDFLLYFSKYSNFIDLTEYGLFNDTDLQKHLPRPT